MRALRPGDVLENRYELLRAWSSGGMGTVWLARTRGLHGFEKLFAIKVPRPELAREADLRAMFVDEARIIAQIRHGNVIAVEHLGDDDGTPYLVLEWVQGTSWMAFIDACHRAGALPRDVMLRIASSACAGLHAAHELRGDTGHLLEVVHRDVSPHNVLVAETGTTKVIDFGIAKARGRMAERTQQGLVKAKLEFAAPEQLGFRRVDRRADVWGMGVVLHLIFAGRLPFEAREDRGVIGAIARGLQGPLPAHVPADVAEIIRTALRVDPRERFQSAAEMKAALDGCITSPAGPDTVAACLREVMPEALAERRAEVRRAVSDANVHAGGPRAPAPLAPTPPEARPRSRMTPVAWALVVASTVVVVGVWTRIVQLAVEMRAPGAQRAAEGRSW